MSEFVNQWVGGMERLRWAHGKSPARRPGSKAPGIPAQRQPEHLAAWAATWQGLRSVTVQKRQRRSPLHPAPPGATGDLPARQGPELAGRQATAAVQKVDASMAQVQRAGVRGKAAIQQAARDLAALKFWPNLKWRLRCR